jgi:hypothetical protein
MGNAAQKATSAATRTAVQAAKEAIAKAAPAAGDAGGASAAAAPPTRASARVVSPLSQAAPAAASRRPAPDTPLQRVGEVKPFDMDALKRRAQGKGGEGAGADGARRGGGGGVGGPRGSGDREGQLFTYGDTGSLSSSQSTSPLDAEAAAVQARVGASSGGGSSTVSVRRLVPSGPAAPGAASIHEKSETTVRHVDALDGSIKARPDDGVGARNFKVWEAMQLVR